MSVIRENLIDAAIDRAYALIDYNIHDNIHKEDEFQKQVILADESLTKDEKSEAIRELAKIYDSSKIIFNSGTRRVCENCNQKCLATLYCEFCVRNYLKANFSNWTSGNDDIDNLIQECQMKTTEPDSIVEWIPYSNLININYLTKGGCSEIYAAVWIDGCFIEWDSKEQQLKRFEEQGVVLKRLEKIESANKRWFEEAISHLNISNKWSNAIVQCYGLTQDPLNGDYMLVLNKLDIDLRRYLQQNHNQLTWKKRIQIAADIILALRRIHDENAIHRDLHSGNILVKIGQGYAVSDLGFCGPADKPLKSIYGNLPYIAPEVIAGKETTFKSDIYSIAMLMWEISSGQSPFINYEHDYYLAMNIIKGIRPKIVPGTPIEYKNLMIQCWDANPLKRPDIVTLRKEIRELNFHYQNNSNESTKLEENNRSETNSLENYTSSSKLFTSKLHQFDNLPEPRNATEEEQQAFHSNKSYDYFHIPNHIDDIGKLSNQNNNSSKITSSNKSFKRRLENDFQEIMQQMKRNRINIDDEEEIYNNPNFHSEEQDEFELPENMDEN